MDDPTERHSRAAVFATTAGKGWKPYLTCAAAPSCQAFRSTFWSAHRLLASCTEHPACTPVVTWGRFRPQCLCSPTGQVVFTSHSSNSISCCSPCQPEHLGCRGARVTIHKPDHLHSASCTRHCRRQAPFYYESTFKATNCIKPGALVSD